jgi:hypothetical protein
LRGARPADSDLLRQHGVPETPGWQPDAVCLKATRVQGRACYLRRARPADSDLLWQHALPETHGRQPDAVHQLIKLIRHLQEEAQAGKVLPGACMSFSLLYGLLGLTATQMPFMQSVQPGVARGMMADIACSPHNTCTDWVLQPSARNQQAASAVAQGRCHLRLAWQLS